MQPFTSDSTKIYKAKIFGISGSPKVLLFKEDDTLFYRSGVILTLRPLQIPSLYPLIDLFTKPNKATLNIQVFKLHEFDSYLVYFFLDSDLSDCPKKNYDPFLKSSLKFHKEQIKLLQKNISLKDFDCKILSAHQTLDFSFSDIPKSVHKYAYQLQYEKEKGIFRNVLFSNPKIKKIDYRRDSIIPSSEIVLGKTISNKDIGVNSHVLFLTGKKEFRRSIIKSLINHFTQQDDYHIVIFDFGLKLSLDKIFFRQFKFDDILFDPFSFKDHLTPSQHTLFISHLSFICKNILRFNDRQIGILEEKLTFYLQQEKQYSWNSFLKFTQDEVSEEMITETSNIDTFSEDVTAGDFTSSLKQVDTPLKSNDLEALLNKLRYLDYLFAKADRTPFSDVFFKNHLDIFSISTTPDLKSLAFYLFNIFYSLNESNYKNYVFMFLDIDSILFDKFNDIDISWIHSDIKNSLFDSNEIFTVKKIFNIIDTRIYASYISNAPYTMLSKTTKEHIDKLQFLHDYCLLESPSLQRAEFFKLLPESTGEKFDLPAIDLFLVLPKLLFSRWIEHTYRDLFTLFDIDRHLLKRLVNNGYLRKNKSSYLLTDRARSLKRVIIDYLSYQPSLSLEENDALINFSDPLRFNIFKQSSFSYDGNIDLLCTRLLANQFSNAGKLNSFLLYQFLEFKKHLIDDQKLLYYVIVSLQNQNQCDEIDQKNLSVIPQKTTPTITTQEDKVAQGERSSKVEIMKDYFSTIKTTIEADPQLIEKDHSQGTTTSATHPTFHFPEHIQRQIDTINQRIKILLPDTNIQFPTHPIFLTMKFLDNDTNDLLNTDLTNLMDSTASDAVIRDDSS